MTADPGRTIVLWCPDWPILAVCREQGLDAGGAHRPHRARSRVRLLPRRAPRRRRARAEAARGAVPLPRARRARLRHRPRPARVRARRAPRRGRRARRAAHAARHPRHARPRARPLLRRRGGRGGGPARRPSPSSACPVRGSASPTVRSRPSRPRGAARRGRRARSCRPGHPPPSSPRCPSALVVDPRTTTLLTRLGVRTLGEFAALPADDVRRRFGAAGAFAHDRAAGREQARVVAAHSAARLRGASSDFEPPLDRVDQVAFALPRAAPRSSSSACAARAPRLHGPARRARRRGRRALEPQLAASAVVHRRPTSSTACAGSCRARARPTRGLASPIVRLRVVPERIDSTRQPRGGALGRRPRRARAPRALPRAEHARPRGGRHRGDRRRAHARRAAGARAVGRPRRPTRARLDAPVAGQPARARARDRVPRAACRSRCSTRAAAIVADRRPRARSPRRPPRFAVGRRRRRGRVRAWAGPWPVDERWWDRRARRRVHRFQVVDDDGCAWLLVLDGEGWWAEAQVRLMATG